MNIVPLIGDRVVTKIGTTFQCIIVLQSKGHGPGVLVPTSTYLFDPCFDLSGQHLGQRVGEQLVLACLVANLVQQQSG